MAEKQRQPNRIEGYDYSQQGAYFVTICTQDRRKILSKITVGTGLLDCPSAGKGIGQGQSGRLVPTIQLLKHGLIAEQCIRRIDAFYDHISVDKYVIMPDHIHMLLTVRGQSGRLVPGKIDNKNSVIAKFVGSFKRFCNKEYGENIWQGRYYDHVVRNQQDYNEIWEYIAYNPTKWAIEKQGRD